MTTCPNTPTNPQFFPESDGNRTAAETMKHHGPAQQPLQLQAMLTRRPPVTRYLPDEPGERLPTPRSAKKTS